MSYPALQLSVTAGGTKFISAMTVSHITPLVLWHMEADKFDQGHMDAFED